MPPEGEGLHRLPRRWRRETPGFPQGRVEEASIPEPVGSVYQLTGEVLERILRDAGWVPTNDEIRRQQP